MFTLKTVSNKGFTLLEVMISVSIIAVIFVSLFRMQSSTIDLATAGKFNTLSPILAKQLLAEIEQDAATWSETQGDFGENFPGIGWTCDISDVSLEELEFVNEDSENGLKKIDIKITDRSEKRSYKITTWRFAVE